MKKLILVRHASTGHTNGNHNNQNDNADLSGIGILESIHLGAFLYQIVKSNIIPPVELFYSSTRNRAVQTASFSHNCYEAMKENFHFERGKDTGVKQLYPWSFEDKRKVGSNDIYTAERNLCWLEKNWNTAQEYGCGFTQPGNIFYDDFASLEKVATIPNIGEANCILIVGHEPFLQKLFLGWFKNNVSGVIADWNTEKPFSEEHIKLSHCFNLSIHNEDVPEINLFENLPYLSNFSFYDAIKNQEFVDYLNNLKFREPIVVDDAFKKRIQTWI